MAFCRIHFANVSSSFLASFPPAKSHTTRTESLYMARSRGYGPPRVREKDVSNQLEGKLMRLRACLLAIAVVLPIRAFAQTPPPAAPPPPAVAAPAAPEKPAEAAAPAPASATPAATMVAVPATPPPAPAPVPAGPAPKFTFGGLVDTYYQFNF